MFHEVSQDALVLLRAMKGHHDEHNNPARPLSKGFLGYTEALLEEMQWAVALSAMHAEEPWVE